MRAYAKLIVTLTAVLGLPVAVAGLAGVSLAQAQSAPQDASISKMNAYVEFLNQSLRASESLQRYDSWVDMEKGPTGKEKIIYGLYSLYDVRKEAAAVLSAAQADPRLPELDGSMVALVETYQKLAPVIERANKYYEREDYRSDKMAEGKSFHKDIVAFAPIYVKQREKAETALRVEKVKVDIAALEALERAKGKGAKWQVRNVMFRAEAVMDLMPSNEKPIVEMKSFKPALSDYAAAVREFDDYALANPGSFAAFESNPASLLSKLREFDEKLVKAKGDARKGAGDDMTWLISDYNSMVSTSEMATIFSED